MARLCAAAIFDYSNSGTLKRLRKMWGLLCGVIAPRLVVTLVTRFGMPGGKPHLHSSCIAVNAQQKPSRLKAYRLSTVCFVSMRSTISRPI
jgi:hypothetical protein